MSDFETAVTWLNHFDKSSMTEATHFLIDRFREASDSGDDPDQKASIAEAAAKASKNPVATGEALILIADKRYRDGRFKLAWTGLKNAVTIFLGQEKQKKSSSAKHRLWVARWLCGWAAWRLHLHYTAYETWRYALDDVDDLIKNSADEGNSDKEVWYQGVRGKMQVEFACRVEEAYTWLYNFPEKNIRVRKPAGKKVVDKLLAVDDVESELNVIGMSKMGEDLIRLRNRVITEVKRAEDAQSKLERESMGDFRVVRQVVQDVSDALELRNDLNERAEAQLECGLAMHQIRDNRQANTYMERAVSNYLPGCHQKAVARWMLGIIQTQPESGSTNAFNSFRKSIDEMTELKQRAHIAGNKQLVDWYVEKIAEMQKAMDLMRKRVQINR